LEIHLQLYSILREKLPIDAKGGTVMQLDEGATLADLINELDIKLKVIISKSRQLREGDHVKIFSSVSGG